MGLPTRMQLLATRLVSCLIFGLGVALAVGLGGCGAPVVERWGFGMRSESTWYLSTWAPDEAYVFVVGGEPASGDGAGDDSGRGVALRRVGKSWVSDPLPAGTGLLNWVFGFSTVNAWAVGEGGVILHYEGEQWTKQTSPTTESLWGVWGATEDDLWAVGGGGREGDLPVLIHYDGTTWENVVVPALERAQVRAFFKVWGVSADQVYVVGQQGVVLHWNGESWVEINVGTSDDLIALWGTTTSPSGDSEEGTVRVAMVGGRSNGVVVYGEGTASEMTWQARTLEAVPGLNGVWMAGSTVCVAGQRGTVGEITVASLAAGAPEFRAQELDGRDLAAYPVGNDDFHAVFGVGQERVAVGGNLAAPTAPYRGMVWRRVER